VQGAEEELLVGGQKNPVQMEELEEGQDGPTQTEKLLELVEGQDGPVQMEKLDEEDVSRLQELSQLKSSKVSYTQ